MNTLVKPRLKPTIQVYQVNQHIYFETSGYVTEAVDETGLISALCNLMDGTRDIQLLSTHLRGQYREASVETIAAILTSMDEAYLLEDEAVVPPEDLDHYDRRRWHRNFDFFGAFCRSDESKYLHQLKIKNARVALLGLGGLGSHILYDLVALGAHDIRAVDFDRVDLSNLNRQILYGEHDIGELKTEIAKDRIHQFNSRLHIEFINQRLTATEDIEALIQDRDIVIGVADKPKIGIIRWLNEACVRRQVPFINAGLDTKRAIYYTVVPYQSGCVECWKAKVRENDQLSASLLDADEEQDNPEEPPRPAIVHFVSLITGFVVAEFIKLITQITAPVAINRLLAIDFETMNVTEAEKWDRHQHCPLCANPSVRHDNCESIIEVGRNQSPALA